MLPHELEGPLNHLQEYDPQEGAPTAHEAGRKLIELAAAFVRALRTVGDLEELQRRARSFYELTRAGSRFDERRERAAREGRRVLLHFAGAGDPLPAVVV